MPGLRASPTTPLSHQPSKASIAASDVTCETFYTVEQRNPSSASTPRPRFSTPVQSFTPRTQFSTPLQSFTSQPKAIIPKAVEPTSSCSPPPALSSRDSYFESVPRLASSSHDGDKIAYPPTLTSLPTPRSKRPLGKAGKPAAMQHNTARASGSSLQLERLDALAQTRLGASQSTTTFFRFPSVASVAARPHTAGALFTLPGEDADGKEYMPRAPPPMQTQQYWTSDSTRRREYAAIDAASRGFGAWCYRHLIPDCMIPDGQRRLGFDDDGGSVRRYRIQLDHEKEEAREVQVKKKRFRTWLRNQLGLQQHE